MVAKDLSVNGARSELLASREAWLALDREDNDRPIVEVPVPEFGLVDGKPRAVLMRAMRQDDEDEWEYRYSGEMQFAFTAEQAQERQAPRKSVLEVQRGMKALLVSLCVVDERGERLFSRDDIALLQRRNAAAINRLASKADELCGITQADREALERRKNSSGEAPGAAPPSV